MTLRLLPLLGFASLLLAADNETPRNVRVSQTQTAQIPARGVLKLAGLDGFVTIQAWDRPDVEIAVTRYTRVPQDTAAREATTREVDAFHVTATTNGSELVIAAESKPSAFDLQYQIKAPASANIVVDHRDGEVYVDGFLGDIDVKVHDGNIMIRLPQDANFQLSAASKWGNVVSDYGGGEKRRWWLTGHSMTNGTAPRKLNLRISYGDIVILKSRSTSFPEPLAAMK